MIDLAVNQLSERLKQLSFLDLVGGVARQQKIKVGGVIKTVPASHDPNNEDGYVLLSPDEKHAGIAYFEVLSNRRGAEIGGGRAFQFAATIRLVAWFDTKRLAPSSMAPAAMAEIVGTLSGKYDDVAPLGSLVVTPEQEAPRSADIFAKYNYNETETQFLMLPFEYFAFDFSMTFTMLADCQTVNVVQTSEQC